VFCGGAHLEPTEVSAALTDGTVARNVIASNTAPTDFAMNIVVSSVIFLSEQNEAKLSPISRHFSAT
jgi:hypothetical protein